MVFILHKNKEDYDEIRIANCDILRYLSLLKENVVRSFKEILRVFESRLYSCHKRDRYKAWCEYWSHLCYTGGENVRGGFAEKVT